jgi:hypothetical protein
MIDVKMALGGDKQFAALLKQIEKLETSISGVQLLGRRLDETDSQIIVDSLIERDRDFFSPDNAVAESVAAAAAIELEKRLSAAAELDRPDPSDTTLAAAMFMAAMEAYMAAVAERIESQRTVYGSAPRELTSEYAAYKLRIFGFERPIGKASGQLLEALTPGGGTAGKIELQRR